MRWALWTRCERQMFLPTITLQQRVLTSEFCPVHHTTTLHYTTPLRYITPHHGVTLHHTTELHYIKLHHGVTLHHTTALHYTTPQSCTASPPHHCAELSSQLLSPLLFLRLQLYMLNYREGHYFSAEGSEVL